eukprot:2860911-Pyramimonas_sp.AAC.4
MFRASSVCSLFVSVSTKAIAMFMQISKHFLPKWHSWRCVVKGILKGRSNSLPFCGLGTGGWRPEERVLDPFDGEAVARGMVYYE